MHPTDSPNPSDQPWPPPCKTCTDTQNRQHWLHLLQLLLKDRKAQNRQGGSNRSAAATGPGPSPGAGLSEELAWRVLRITVPDHSDDC